MKTVSVGTLALAAAGLGSLDGDIKKNADGSIDIYFSPKAMKDKNWIQTIPGKSW